jgi:hypothetical protein
MSELDYLNIKESGVKWIVITGNPLDGFRFHGTFETSTQACEYGHKNFEESGFDIDLLIKHKENRV